MKQNVILFFFVFSTPLLQAQASLQYTLEKDDIFTVRQNAKQVITQQLDGATHELTNTMNGILEFKVLTERDSTYDIALTFKDLNLKITSSIQGELMNVRAQEISGDDMQSKIFNSLLNIPVKIVLAKTGAILNVEGGDSLVVKMAKASGLEDEFSLNMMKKSLQNEFGSEALSKSYEQMTFIYPRKKVNVGDQWENEYSGKLEANNSWTLDGLTSDSAIITGNSDVVMDVTEPTTTMKLNGKQQTEITADLKSGFIQKMKVEGLSEGASTMTQLGNQEIPTTIQSTVTYIVIPNTQNKINN